MKTLFNGKGKLWLAVLIALCAVVSACAAFVCLFNSNNKNVETASATTYKSASVRSTSFNHAEVRAGNQILMPYLAGRSDFYIYVDIPSGVSVSSCYARYEDSGYNYHCADCRDARFDATVVTNSNDKYIRICFKHEKATASGEHNLALIINGDTNTEYCMCVQIVTDRDDLLYCPVPTLSTTTATYSATTDTKIGINYGCECGNDYMNISLPSNKWSSGNAITIPAGTPVGTYEVEFYVTDDDGEYFRDGSTSKTYTITIKKQGIAIPTLSKGSGVASSATVSGQTATTAYTGSEQHFTISSTTNITFGTPTSGSTRSNNDFYATNVNTSGYTVSMSLTDKSNYCWGSDGSSDKEDKTLKIVINRASIARPSAAGKTYTGVNQTLISNFDSSKMTATYKYTPYNTTDATAVGSATSTTSVSYKNAGTYVFTFTPKGNYQWSSGTNVTSSTGDISVTLAQATLTPSSTISAKAYDGNTTGSGTISLTGAKNNESPTATGTFTWTSASVGTTTYNVTNIALGAGWRNNYKLSATSLSNKSNSGVAITNIGITRPTAASKTYTGVNQTLISNFDSNKMTATYKYTPYNTTDATAVGSATATTSVSYKNAGTYVFTFTPKGNYQWSTGSNVTSSTGDITVTIAQATLTPSSTISTKAYNGNTAGSGTISLTGAKNNESPTATGTFTWTSANAGTSTYNVTSITLGAGWRNNYTLSATSLSNKSNTGVTITRASIARPAAASKTYTGVNQTLISNFDSNKMTATYKYTPYNTTDATAVGSATSTTSVSYKNAGTYVFTFTPGSNYQWSSGTNVTSSTGDISVTLAQATLTPSSTISTKAYNGNTTGSGTISLTGAVNGEKPTATGTFTWTSANAGTSTYNVTSITLGAGWRNNYTLSATSLSNKSNTGVTITKASQSKPTITATTTTVACDNSITLTSSGQGTLTWTVTSTANSGAVDKTTGTGTSFTITGTHWGTVSVTVKAGGNDNYNASAASDAKSITVQRKAIAIPTLATGTGASGATVSGQTATTTYTGSAQHFTISSTTNINFGTPTTGATLSGTDFYATNASTSAYTVSMSINGDKYCWGTSNGGTDVANKTLSITITAKSISDATIAAIADQTYTGSAITPPPSVTLSGYTPTYTVSYSANTNVGTNATVTITGTGNFTGTASKTFNIVAKSISDATIAAIADQTYTGSAITPTPSVTLTGYTPTYTVSYKNNTNAGTATVIITGTGNFDGTASRDFKINKAKYDISGLSMTDKTVTYNGDVHKIVAVGASVSGVTITGYKYNDKLVDGVSQADTYTVSAVFSIDNEDNYEMPELSATLIINKATPKVTVDVATGTFYVGDNLSEVVDIAVATQDVSGRVAWTNSSALITGLDASYGWTFVPDDTTNYNNATGLAKVGATYKLVSITLSNVKANYIAFDTFDKDSLVVTATYAAGKNPTQVTNFTFTYPGSTQYFLVADDGKQVTVYYTEGIITVQATITVSVGKKDYDLTGVEWDYTEAFTYDGKGKSVSLTGDLPKSVTVKEYTDNLKTGAGEYTASVSFDYDTANYNEPTIKDLNWIINKATPELNVDGVETEYGYTGDEQEIISGAIVDSDQKILYSNNKFTTVAQGNGLVVEISVVENDNWLSASKTVQITVAKAALTAEWTGGNGVYDGTVHSASLNITGGVKDADGELITNATLNDACTVNYTAITAGNDKLTYAGTYAPALNSYPSSEPFCNYDLTITNASSYTFTVDKASVGTITFENDDTVIYDGGTHYLTIKETLPDEVKVEYYITGLSTKFEGVTDVKIVDGNVVGYNVTAKFSCESGNYVVPAEKDAVLTINPRELKDGYVSGIEETYVYTGDYQTPAPVVKLTLTDGGEEVTLSFGKNYRVTYTGDNLNADNTVEVKIEGIGNYGGFVTKYFTITKKALDVNWIGANDKYVYNGINQGISATLDGVVAKDLGTIKPTITYVGRGATSYSSGDKPVDTGFYSISVGLSEEFTKNYERFETLVKNFEIEKAELEVTIDWDGYDPATDTLYMGGTLPGIKLISAKFGDNDIAGELSWVSESISEKMTDTYIWQYKPAEEYEQNFNTYYGTESLNAIRAPIAKIEAELNEDAPEIYVTTTLETLKNYITVTGTFADNKTSTEIKGYSLTSKDFEETPSIANVYKLLVSYNGIDCTLEVEYKPVMVTGITVTARDPESGIKTAYEGYDEFDRTSIIVTAERNDGYTLVLADNEYNVEYVTAGKDFFCVGDTYVIISYGTGANRKADEITVTVDRKEFDISGIGFADDSVIFDGTAHKTAIVGVFSKGTVDYEYWKDGVRVNINEGISEAGEYTVKAVFTFADATDEKNYKPVTLEKSFTIEKAVYSNVKFDNITADYNLGQSLGGHVKVEGLPEGDEVILTYTITNKTTGETLSSLDDIKNAGTYEITVAFSVDGNHMPINDKKATFVVNKLKPQVDPKWRGSLTQGTQLSKVLLEAGDNEVAGTYKWKVEDYELQTGLNRCSYVFTPDDTTNYEVVTSYMDLTVVGGATDNQPANGGTLSTGLTVAIMVVMAACLLVSIIALSVAMKKPKGGDADGFYDDVSEKDLTA